MSRAQLTSTVEQNTGGAVSPYVAGKNKIINGDFTVAQRGTSFTPTPGGGVIYTVDRFNSYNNGSGSLTISQQALSSGSIAGYEAPYFLQAAMTSVGTSTGWNIVQPIEDVHTLANQTVTLSFWAKGTSAFTFTVTLGQKFGSGGSAGVDTNSSNISVGTSWARYSVTLTLPSIAGKTIGAGSYLNTVFNLSAAVNTFSFAGVQLEAGSVATPFTTATGTLSGELAACQRYYISNGQVVTWQGNTTSASSYIQTVTFPVTMRTAPTIAVTNYSASNFSASPSSGTATTGGFLGVNSATATASAAYYQFTYIASAEL